MNFRQFFAPRQNRRFRAQKSGKPVAAGIRAERLEDRTLLAGDVTAQLIGSSAFLTGDAADNTVEILIVNGNVVVRGSDSTTVNGSTSDFVLATGTTQIGRDLFVNLTAGGTNQVGVSGIQIGRDVVIRGGAGADQVSLLASGSVGRHVIADGGAGNDTFTLEEMSVGRNVAMSGDSGDDLMVLKTTTVAHNVSLIGGKGNDGFVIDQSTISGNLSISGRRGNDNIAIRTSQIQRNLSIAGNSGADVILLDGTTALRRTTITGGGGVDNIVMRGTSSFSNPTVVRGGARKDNFEVASGVSFGKLRFSSFSGFTADATAVDSRITSTTTGVLAAAESALKQFNSGLTVSLSAATISEGDGAAASTLTVTRSGDLTSALAVTLTTNPATQN
ncbi:MAG: hypothetical protein R3C49_17930 [Planctomycetaceae bacterium]